MKIVMMFLVLFSAVNFGNCKEEWLTIFPAPVMAFTSIDVTEVTVSPGMTVDVASTAYITPMCKDFDMIVERLDYRDNEQHIVVEPMWGTGISQGNLVYHVPCSQRATPAECALEAAKEAVSQAIAAVEAQRRKEKYKAKTVAMLQAFKDKYCVQPKPVKKSGGM